MGFIFFTYRYKTPLFAVSNPTLQSSSIASVNVFINRADRLSKAKVHPLPQLILNLLKASERFQMPPVNFESDPKWS